MPRIIIAADPVASKHLHSVLLDEEVMPVHLEDEHCSLQLLERLELAVRDAARASEGLTHMVDPAR